MKKVGTLVFCAVAIAVVASWKVASVQAFPAFKKEFDKKYIKDPPTTPEETALKTAVAEAKCGVCHTKVESDPSSKKVRNSYGRAISKLLPDAIGKADPSPDDKKAFTKETDKIDALLDKVAGEKSDAKDANSPTFGELIKQGKLPGKDLPPE